MLTTSLNKVTYGQITVEFERVISMRRTEIVIITHDSEGGEVQAKLVFANDDGTLTGGYYTTEGADIVVPS